MEKEGIIFFTRSIDRSPRPPLIASVPPALIHPFHSFYYNLMQDGTVEMEVKLTGILSVGNLGPEDLNRKVRKLTVCVCMHQPHTCIHFVSHILKPPSCHNPPQDTDGHRPYGTTLHVNRENVRVCSLVG